MTTEVTQGMFYQIMGHQAWNGYSASYGVGADYPAYFVSWHMADFAEYGDTTTQQCERNQSARVLQSVLAQEQHRLAVRRYRIHICSGYVLPTGSGVGCAKWHAV